MSFSTTSKIPTTTINAAPPTRIDAQEEKDKIAKQMR